MDDYLKRITLLGLILTTIQEGSSNDEQIVKTPMFKHKKLPMERETGTLLT